MVSARLNFRQVLGDLSVQTLCLLLQKLVAGLLASGCLGWRHGYLGTFKVSFVE